MGSRSVSMKSLLTKDQKVIINTPDNIRLHGHDAIVESITEWGAHVLTKAAATGRFRALFSEMVIANQDESLNDSSEDGPLTIYRAKGMGYTGDICIICNGYKIIRNGTCLMCQECGHTSGCT